MSERRTPPYGYIRCAPRRARVYHLVDISDKQVQQAVSARVPIVMPCGTGFAVALLTAEPWNEDKRLPDCDRCFAKVLKPGAAHDP